MEYSVGLVFDEVLNQFSRDGALLFGVTGNGDEAREFGVTDSAGLKCLCGKFGLNGEWAQDRVYRFVQGACLMNQGFLQVQRVGLFNHIEFDSLLQGHAIKVIAPQAWPTR